MSTVIHTILSFKGEHSKTNVKFQVQSGFEMHGNLRMRIRSSALGRPRGKSCKPCKDNFAHHLLNDKTYLLHSIVSTLNIRN